MTPAQILDHIRRGRTDLVFDLLALPDWRNLLHAEPYGPLSWFVYYNDTTAMKAVLAAGGSLAGLNLDMELAHAAFFGHWKMCDFLLCHGANPRAQVAETGETPLHGALAKAQRPAHNFVVRLLLEHGADANARTIPGRPTEAFMRDTRTRGETPLHRAAAFGDAEAIRLLLDNGADKTIRDANGDTALSWASWHLRPGSILSLLAYDAHTISAKQVATITSDHGAGWGHAMERKLLGDYLPSSLPTPVQAG